MSFTIYPCDRGTGTPQGWHNFIPSAWIVVCSYCGKRPPRT